MGSELRPPQLLERGRRQRDLADVAYPDLDLGVPTEHTAEIGFWARLTGAQSLGANRYIYAWEEVEYDSATRAWSTKTNGRTGTFTADPAINPCEGANVESGVLASGVDNTSDDYPSGFSMLPIGGNGGCLVPVRMYTGRDKNGVSYKWFSPLINTDWGPC